MINFIIFTILIVLVLSPLIIIHELGHLVVCRWLGVRVERFSVGFGKELFGFYWKDIRWSFCILPLGGYVKPAGEDPDEKSGAPDEFFSQPWYSRIAIAMAGPVMNYFLAFICFFWLVFVWGEAIPGNKPIVGDLKSKFPAAVAGLQKGDEILAINGYKISTWSEIKKQINIRPEKAVDLKISRVVNGETIVKTLALVPVKHPKTGEGQIGIYPPIEISDRGFIDSVKYAYNTCYGLSALTLHYLGTRIKDAIIKREKPDIEVAGPIGIINIIVLTLKQGFEPTLRLIAILSLNLGLFNLFPIPILDGGHILFYFLEGIFGKPLNQKAMRAATLAGAAFLILILVYATSQDITRMYRSFYQ